MSIAKAIDTIYNEREQFIVIGLTGRTGSGCTTVSKRSNAKVKATVGEKCCINLCTKVDYSQ